MFFPEQEYKRSNKSEEELIKLTLDENLTEIERAKHILMKGQQLQKTAIYSNLHRILLEPQAFDNLFEIIMYFYLVKYREEIQQQEEDNQVAAAKSLQKLIRTTVLQEKEQLQIFYLSAQILKIWSLPVLNEWVQTMDVLLHKTGLSLFAQEIQQLVLLLTDSSQPTISRQCVSNLLGTIVQIFGNAVPQVYLDRVRHLCSDHDKEVRLVMAQEVMAIVCNSISSELIETYLLEKIMELYYDTDSVVRSSGMKLFFNVAPCLSPEVIKTRCVKLFLDQIQSQSEESKLAMSQVCGRIYNLIQGHLIEKQHNMFLQIYKEFAKHKNPEVRVNFLSNFPALLSLSMKKFDYFQDSYQLCCIDMNEQVLRSLLSSLHEIVLLSENTEFHCKIILNFMKSSNYSVLEVLINRFSLLINSFQINQQPLFGPASLDLLEILLSKNQWNLQIDFLAQLLECQQIFLEIDAFIGTLQNCIEKGIPETKKLCANNIAKYLSQHTNLSKRNNVICKLFQTYYKSNSCFNRITFIDIVEAFSHQISRRLFKTYGFFDLLQYAKDPIVNVRIRLIKSLPFIKLKIEQDDIPNQQLFNETVQHCIESDTRSFQQVILQTKQELLKYYDEVKIALQDQQMQQAEEIIYQTDLKQRQFQLDQEEDYKIENTDFLCKYRKKYSLSKTKIHSNVGLQSQTMLAKKDKLQMSAGGLLFKKAISDLDGNKSPFLDQLQRKSKVLPKSLCEVKKQFKLPSIKK